MTVPPVAFPFLSATGADLPATALAIDYAPDQEIALHQHPVCQLIYGVKGVMVVATAAGQWIVPPTRAVWVPCATDHRIQMVGHVQMRTAYIRPEAAPNLPQDCSVVSVSALLRELLLEAVAIKLPYQSDSRDGRLMRLLLDEIVQMPTLPLGLPYPADPRLQMIQRAIEERPDDETTATEWAQRLKLNPKTIHRLFLNETGLTFGQWRQQARLLVALELLAKGERVIDIALAVGYRSPTAFSSMFVRQFGVSPSDFFRRLDGEP